MFKLTKNVLISSMNSFFMNLQLMKLIIKKFVARGAAKIPRYYRKIRVFHKMCYTYLLGMFKNVSTNMVLENKLGYSTH